MSKRFLSLHIFFFQIKVCSSTTSTECEGIHEISEKLKAVSAKGENHIVEDVKLTVDVVEKIVTRVDLSNIEKTPKVCIICIMGELSGIEFIVIF